ncbi:MAG: beta-lactamase family protein [Gluconacetobacter diazotrophicus]|nr:beta-lactamase family protein [Gluconacetobacter diazotrophicus]
MPARSKLPPILALLAALVPVSGTAAGASPPAILPEAQLRAVDDSVREWLRETGAPSVSVSVVLDGRLLLARAWGAAVLNPDRPADAATRYAVDSISKQFTAAAVLLEQADGRLSLDDTVGRFLPTLSGGNTVTIRQLLNHTAGYRDYWPQDYVPAWMRRPVGRDALLAAWAGNRPLDFVPGTDWQYSNTGYAVAGAIVERRTGMKLMDVLRARIFKPLGMDDVTEDDTAPLPDADAHSYTRHALGPVRPAPKEGAGWLFAASELAMTPTDLARWNISLMNRSLLPAAAYDAMETSTVLRNGRDTRYGLGLSLASTDGWPALSHDGAGSGFLAANAVWPAQRAAICAFTNQDWAGPDEVVDRIAFVVLPPPPEDARARTLFAQLRAGRIDRTLLTDDANAELDDRAVADAALGLAEAGPTRLFRLDRQAERGGLVTRLWRVRTANRRLRVVERSRPDGRIEQFSVMPSPD